MKLLHILGALVILPRQGVGFHVDSSPQHTRKTYLKRKQTPSQIRHEDQLPPEALSDDERSWRFPESSRVRPIGDKTLPSLSDQDRLWRQPTPNMLRNVPTMGNYLDEDRMWRRPSRDVIRDENTLPPKTLKDEERFWWKDESFEHLLLEDDEETTNTSSQNPQTEHLFRRPSAKFSRHPHSKSEFDESVVSTMVEDDSLGWLTESTNKLLMDEEDPRGDDYMGTF